MRNLISVTSVLWLVLGTVTVVHSKFTATEKKDLMMINMNKIRNGLGSLTTQTKYLNNRPIYSCQQQGPDSLSDVADMDLGSVHIDSSNDTTSTLQQILVSNIQNVKTSFLNFNDRLNNLSCENLTTTTTAATTTTATTTTTAATTTTTPTTTTAAATTTTTTTKTPTTSTTTTTTTTTTQMIESMINTTSCSSSEFRCGDGTCIPRYWLCDAQEDCQDCSDEKNCTKDMIAAHWCPDHLFKCRLSGTCITRDWLCDDFEDCPHGEDEENCGSAGVGPTTTPSYGPGDIPCEAGGLPVPNYYRCDGTTDCDNCMDEEQCVECPEEFSAVGHQCLHIDKVKRNWKEASMHCQKLGGRLAEPRDLDALSCFMKEKEGLRARYWVGGSKIKGRWLWSGGAAVPQSLLPSGAHHQSLNNRPDKNCLEIMPRRNKSPFNISNCQTKFRSLCQIDYIN